MGLGGAEGQGGGLDGGSDYSPQTWTRESTFARNVLSSCSTIETGKRFKLGQGDHTGVGGGLLVHL